MHPKTFREHSWSQLWQLDFWSKNVFWPNFWDSKFQSPHDFILFFIHVEIMGLKITPKALTVIKCIRKHLETNSKSNYDNLIFGQKNVFLIKILDFEILSLDAIIGHQRVCHQSLDVPKNYLGVQSNIWGRDFICLDV